MSVCIFVCVCVCVCVIERASGSGSLCFMLYSFPWPAKLAWQQKEVMCVRFIKNYVLFIIGTRRVPLLYF